MRRWRQEDREPFAALNVDPAVREHFQGPMLREDSDAFIDRIEHHWDEHGWGNWAIEVPDVAPFIGYVGLWPADYVANRPMVEVGWRLAREHWAMDTPRRPRGRRFGSALRRSGWMRSCRSRSPRTCVPGASWSASA